MAGRRAQLVTGFRAGLKRGAGTRSAVTTGAALGIGFGFVACFVMLIT